MRSGREVDLATGSSENSVAALDEIGLPGRKYFYAPGVYLTGIDMRRSVLLRKLVSRLVRSTQSLEILEQLR
jgi:hypothetical protein